MELSKFTVNCAKYTQFADPCPELHEICALHAHFSRFCIHSSKIVKICAIHVILSFCRFCMTRLAGNNPGYSEFSKPQTAVQVPQYTKIHPTHHSHPLIPVHSHKPVVHTANLLYMYKCQPLTLMLPQFPSNLH